MRLRTRERVPRSLTRELRRKADLLRAREQRAGDIAQSLGALALGAVALGAAAMGALAIGRLAIGHARIRRLEIDELVVRDLDVTGEMRVPTKADPER